MLSDTRQGEGDRALWAGPLGEIAAGVDRLSREIEPGREAELLLDFGPVLAGRGFAEVLRVKLGR